MIALGIFDSISTTKTHNRILEVNIDNCVACRERFVIPLSTFYKPMIKVQMCLYKTDGVFSSCLLLLFGEYTEVVYITYTMASRDSPDIYTLA